MYHESVTVMTSGFFNVETCGQSENIYILFTFSLYNYNVCASDMIKISMGYSDPHITIQQYPC